MFIAPDPKRFASLLRSSNNFGEFGFYKHFIPTG
jgi:hypothetical protein